MYVVVHVSIHVYNILSSYSTPLLPTRIPSPQHPSSSIIVLLKSSFVFAQWDPTMLCFCHLTPAFQENKLFFWHVNWEWNLNIPSFLNMSCAYVCAFLSFSMLLHSKCDFCIPALQHLFLYFILSLYYLFSFIFNFFIFCFLVFWSYISFLLFLGYLSSEHHLSNIWSFLPKMFQVLYLDCGDSYTNLHM
jgi:hypothetical protein